MSTAKSTRNPSIIASIPASRNIYNSSRSTTMSTTGANISWNPPHSHVDDLIEYIDLLYSIVGVDINFEKFRGMTDSDKKNFIRDIKIKKIIQKDDNY